MIVPRTKLMVFTGTGFAAGSLLYVADAALGPFTALVWLCVVLVLVVDAMLGLPRLTGLRATLPELVRLTKDRPGVVPITLHAGRYHGLSLDLGISLPAWLETSQEVWSIRLPVEAEEAHFEVPCTARRRGKAQLTQVHVQTRSPLRLWDLRKTLPVAAELRVYPSLLAERKRLAALFLNRGNVGIHAQRRVGKGRDFEQLREYIAGDSSEDIHWKATARRGHLVTKVFQLERTQEVYVIIDASRLSARTFVDAEGVETQQLERFITAAMTLGLIAEKQGDLFGLVTFSDTVGHFLRAGAGMGHYHAVREAVYALETKPVNPDFEELFTFLRLRLRRRALLLFLTSLDDPVLAETFSNRLPLIAKRHLVLVNAITPPDARALFSAPDAEAPEDVYDRLAGHLQWRDLRELQQVLHREGVTMHLLANEALTPEMVSQYIGVKQRQLL